MQSKVFCVKLLSRQTAILISLILLTLNSIVVEAATDPYWAYGMQSRTMIVKDYSSSYNNVWTNILNKSCLAWNNSKAGITIRTASTSDNKIAVKSYKEDWYGLFKVENSSTGGYVKKFTISVNSRRIKEDAKNFENFARSTIVHEFGHGFWLCDNPNTTKSSIMKYSRNRNTMVEPQDFDVNNVRKKY